MVCIPTISFLINFLRLLMKFILVPKLNVYHIFFARISMIAYYLCIFYDMEMNLSSYESGDLVS